MRRPEKKGNTNPSSLLHLLVYLCNTTNFISFETLGDFWKDSQGFWHLKRLTVYYRVHAGPPLGSDNFKIIYVKNSCWIHKNLQNLALIMSLLQREPWNHLIAQQKSKATTSLMVRCCLRVHHIENLLMFFPVIEQSYHNSIVTQWGHRFTRPDSAQRFLLYDRKKRGLKWNKYHGNARNAEIYDLCKNFFTYFFEIIRYKWWTCVHIEQ